MLIVTLTLLAALLGGLAGALIGQLLHRLRPKREQPPAVRAIVDPLTGAEIDQVAASWAAAQGRPAAAGLLAEKLRLAFSLRPSPRPFDQDEPRRWRP
jgi:hypothetical protein